VEERRFGTDWKSVTKSANWKRQVPRYDWHHSRPWAEACDSAEKLEETRPEKKDKDMVNPQHPPQVAYAPAPKERIHRTIVLRLIREVAEESGRRVRTIRARAVIFFNESNNHEI